MNCPGAIPQTPKTLLTAAMSTASEFCSDTAIGDGEKYLSAASDIHMLAISLSDLVQSPQASPDFVTALENAQTTGITLLSSSCGNTRTACNRGAILWYNILGLLLNSGFYGYPQVMENALQLMEPQRAQLFRDYKVMMADNNKFSSASLVATLDFYRQLPNHLLVKGVTMNSKFATMTCRDHWKCGSDESNRGLLQFHERAFNVFGRNVGATPTPVPALNAVPTLAFPHRRGPKRRLIQRDRVF